MAGALAQQPPDPFEDAAPGGALSSAGSADYQDEGYPADYNADGQDEEVPSGNSYSADAGRQLLQGALSQIGAQGKAKTAASQQQTAAIERAKASLRLLGSQAPNPFREMMAGLGQNTRTGRFGESVGNALAARQDAETRRRAFDTTMTGAMNELDIAGAKIPWDLAQAQGQDTDRQLRLGEQFLTRADNEEAKREALRERNLNNRAIRDQQRYNQDSLNLERERQHADREAAEQTRRDALEQAKYTWQPGSGPDPDDKDKEVPGSWRFPNHGDEDPKFFPGVKQTSRAGTGGAAGGVAKVKYDYYKAAHANDPGMTPARLEKEAVDVMIGRRQMGPQEARLAAVREASRQAAGQFWSPEQHASKVDEIYKDIMSAGATPAGQPLNANTGGNPGFQTNMPMPQRGAAPAAAPAAVPAPNGSAMVLPPDVRAMLKPGVAKIIKTPTGQTQYWTLQNGQPVQVPAPAR